MHKKSSEKSNQTSSLKWANQRVGQKDKSGCKESLNSHKSTRVGMDDFIVHLSEQGTVGSIKLSSHNNRKEYFTTTLIRGERRSIQIQPSRQFQQLQTPTTIKSCILSSRKFGLLAPESRPLQQVACGLTLISSMHISRMSTSQHGQLEDLTNNNRSLGQSGTSQQAIFKKLLIQIDDKELQRLNPVRNQIYLPPLENSKSYCLTTSGQSAHRHL